MLYRIALEENFKVGMFSTGKYCGIFKEIVYKREPKRYIDLVKASNDFTNNLESPKIVHKGGNALFFFTEKGYKQFENSINTLITEYRKNGVMLKIYSFENVSGKVLYQDSQQVFIDLKGVENNELR